MAPSCSGVDTSEGWDDIQRDLEKLKKGGKAGVRGWYGFSKTKSGAATGSGQPLVSLKVQG